MSERSELGRLNDAGIRALFSLIASSRDVTCPGCQELVDVTDGIVDSATCPNCGHSLTTELSSVATAHYPTHSDRVSRIRDKSKLPPLRLPKQLGPYEIRATLGEGAFGQVIEGVDMQTRRPVAIKVPRRDAFDSETVYESYVERFLQEGHRTAELRHPGIVEVYEVRRDEASNVPYIAMELLEGGTLGERMRQEPRLNRREAAKIVAEVAEATHFAHTNQIYHCDLKPTNILLTKKGRAKVADFGLAVHEDEQLDQEGMIAGTLPYMSPEQLDGKRHFLDGRTDVWSLGVILYELLAGRRPFVGDKISLRKAILSRPVTPLCQRGGSIPEAYDHIVTRCLEKAVERRFPTVLEVGRRTRAAALADRFRIPWILANSRLLVGLVAAFVVAIGLTAWLALSPSNLTTAREYFVDAYAVPGKPHPLLEHRLSEFAVEKSVIPSWTQDVTGGWVKMDSRRYEILKLGTTNVPTYDLSVEIRRTDWVGEVGLCLGMSSRPIEDQSVVADFQGVWIRGNYSIPCRVERKILHSVYDSESKSHQLRSTISICEQTIDTPELDRFHRLEVSVIEGEICEIKWDGHLLEQIVAPRFQSARSLPVAVGPIGIVSFRGSTEFRNAVITVYPKEK